MSRLLFLAAAICIAYCQSPMPSATVTQIPAVTTTMPVAPTTTSAPAPTPAPTSGPPPNRPTDNNYFLNNTDGTVCMHLQGAIALLFNYTASPTNETKYHYVEFKKSEVTIDPSSKCNITAQRVDLNLSYSFYNLILMFQGLKGKDETWNVTGIIVDFTFDKNEFKDYVGPEPPTGVISRSSPASLFENRDVALNQSFSCNANRTIGEFPVVNAHMGIALSVSGLQVQAFQFKNSTSGEFDDSGPSVCVEDNTGNKVVPIAVGAALAGLVIVVLIAYLIGRLRNRRKSTYEALS